MNQKTKPYMSGKQYQIEQRRARVATLLVSGRQQREIAQVLNVSVGTVNSDIKALLLEWKNSALRDTDAAIAIDLERIDAMFRAIWFRVVDGHLPAIDRAEKLIRLRMDIFGYDKPTSSPAKDWQPITVIEVIKDYGPQSTFAHDPDL